MLKVNEIYNQDCNEGMEQIDDETVDLIVTSPPYNLDIKYDTHKDDMPLPEYWKWCERWLTNCFRVLKPDGRLCLNHYLSCGTADKRFAPLMKLNCIAEDIGFKHHGVAIWDDRTLTKRTAWGSWRSASAPYLNCLIPDSLVFTDKGIQTIDSIFTGDQVIDLNGNYAKVINSQCRPHEGQIIKITSQSNLVDPILCTSEHRFYVRERTTTFKGKPYIRKYLWSEPGWIAAGEIIPNSTGGRVAEKQYFIAHPIDGHSDLPDILHSKIPLHNPEFYWFVGFYLAEGSIRNNTNSGKQHARYDIYLTTHISEFNEVSNHLSNLGIKYRVKKWNLKCRFEISNKELYNFVQQFYSAGAHQIKGTKAHLKTIPEWIVRLPKDCLKQLIEGYFSGDGCTFKKRKVTGRIIVSVSKKMLIQTQRILFKLGLYGRITLATKAKTVESFNGENRVVHIKERYNLIWYDHVTRFTPAIFEDDKVWVQIKSVEREEYSGLVYDLTVEGTHTYHLPQGLSHNSPYEGILIMFKDHWKKDRQGVSTITKKEFMEISTGIWKIQPCQKYLTIANFPVALPEKCIRFFSYEGDLVLDPFMGSGTTAVAAKRNNRDYLGFEISPAYYEVAQQELSQSTMDSWNSVPAAASVVDLSMYEHQANMHAGGM